MNDITRIPPHSKDAEEVLLGSMLIGGYPTVIEVIEIVKNVDYLYFERNKIIYSAILEVFQQNKPIDIVVISEELAKNDQLKKIGGSWYLSELMSKTPTATNAGSYAKIVAERYLKRCLIQSQRNVLASAFSESTDPFDLLAQTELEIELLRTKVTGIDSAVNAEFLARDTLDLLLKLNNNELKPMLTGLADLDIATGGFYGGEFIIIGGRPGMGKTALGLTIMQNNSIDKGKIPGGLISLEMTPFQLTIRLCSMNTKIDVKKLRSGNFNKEEKSIILDFFSYFSKANIYFDCSHGLNSMTLKSKAKSLKKRFDIQYLVIDYLQLMEGNSARKNSTRDLEVSDISRTCKAIAIELNIPVFALAQLNRGVEARRDKRPLMMDLRESGSLEQDADSIIFIYRPEYYGIETYGKEKRSTKNIAELIVAKGRNSGTSSVFAYFDKQRTYFQNLSHDYGLTYGSVSNFINEEDVPF